MPKAGWNTVLYIGSQASLATEIEGKYILGLTNDIHMGPTSPELVVPEHVRDGSSMVKKQYAQPGKISPTYTGAQTPLTATAFQWLMASLMSDTSEESAAPVTHIPYTIDTPIVWYSIYKYMEATAGGLEIEGCQVNRIAIDCPADDMCNLTFDFMAMIERKGTVAINGAPTTLNGVGLLTKDATLTWDGGSVNQISMTYELTNNAFFDHQQAQAPVSIKLGPFGVTGSFTMEWDEAVSLGIDADCRAGYDPSNEFEIVCTWGASGAAGYVMLTGMCAINAQPGQVEADKYQQLTVPWIMMSGTLTPSFASRALVPFDMVP